MVKFFSGLVACALLFAATAAQAAATYSDYISVNLAYGDGGTVSGDQVGADGLAVPGWINMSGYNNNANYAASADGSGWTSGTMDSALTATGAGLGSFRVDLYDGGWALNTQWNDAGNGANTLGRSGISNGNMPSGWGPTGLGIQVGGLNTIPLSFQTAGYDIYALMGATRNSGAGLSWVKLNTAPLTSASSPTYSFNSVSKRSLAAIQIAQIFAPPPVYTWTSVDGVGTANWSTASNWTALPDAAGLDVTVGNSGTTPTISLLDAAGTAGQGRTVGSLTFGGSVATTINTHATTTPGTLTISDPTGSTITVGSGSVAHTDVISAPVALASVLTSVNVNSAADQLTLSGPISGAGGMAFVQASSGTVVLGSTSNTYSGATTLQGGVLKANAANTLSPNSILNQSAYGVLDLISGAQTVAGYSIQGGTLSLQVGNVLSVTGSADFYSGSLSLANIPSAPLVTTAYNLISATTLYKGVPGPGYGTVFSNIVLPPNFSLDWRDTGLNPGLDLLYTVPAPSFSGSGTWASTTTSWNAAGNWLDGGNPSNGVPGVDSPTPGEATFDGSGTTAVVLDATPVVSALTFSTSNYSISGGSLDLQSSTGTATVTVNGSTIQNILSDITGTTGTELLKEGTGTLVLSGTNSFAGTIVKAGTLGVASSSSLPDDKPLIVGAGGTLIFAPASSFAGGVIAGTVTTAGAVNAVPEPSTFALLFAGLVVGFGLLRKKK